MLLNGGAAKVQEAVAALEEPAITPEKYRQRICFPALRHLTGTRFWDDQETLQELAKLPDGDQMDVADMLACGDVDSVKTVCWSFSGARWTASKPSPSCRWSCFALRIR